MRTVLLVAGPPASSQMWGPVCARLKQRGFKTELFELFDPPPTDPTVEGLAAALAARLLALGDEVALVAHGTAVPVAREASVRVRPASLVLSNGPIGELDPLTAGLSRLARWPRVFSRTILNPPLWQRLLASSIGLRRTVVNPYVMDRDTVVALSAPYLQSGEHRLAVARFLRNLPDAVGPEPRPRVPTLLLWGTDDRLQPSHVADIARRWMPEAEHRIIAGGQLFHPVERPWAFADALADWLETACSTDAVPG